MSKGLLEVRGTVDRAQFWPKGGSDADTSKIVVGVTSTAFRFRKAGTSTFRVTHAFEDAVVVGRTRKDAISKKGEITIRLQGIDAPELHYPIKSELSDAPKAGQKKRTVKQKELFLANNDDARQPLAESATIALAKHLGGEAGTVDCVVRSYVDAPNDAFDTYGRFVGDVFVENAQKSLNVWLLEQGWAVPAFYNSMDEEEITRLTNAGNAAWENDRGIWPYLSQTLGTYRWKVYRKTGAKPKTFEQDAGDVLLPKLFRRQATWAVNKKATMVDGTFLAYLVAKNDLCTTAEDHLEQGPAATFAPLSDFIGTGGSIDVWPEELVFKESPSRLLRDGVPVTSW